MEIQHFRCVCHSNEHQFQMEYDGEWDRSVVILNPYLNQSAGFWDRFKYSIKYLFNTKKNTVAFDEVILDKESVERLHKFTQEALENWK